MYTFPTLRCRSIDKLSRTTGFFNVLCDKLIYGLCAADKTVLLGLNMHLIVTSICC